MTHISTITFPFSLFETLLNKPSKNLSKSKFSRYTTKIRGKLNFKLNFCKYFYRFRIQTKKKIRADRKKEKKRKEEGSSILSFSIHSGRGHLARTDRRSHHPLVRFRPSFRSRKNFSSCFLSRNLPPCLPPFLCGVAPRSRFPFSLPPSLSLSRDYRGREKLVGGDWISFLRTRSACDYRDSGNCPTSRLLFFRVHV